MEVCITQCGTVSCLIGRGNCSDGRCSCVTSDLSGLPFTGDLCDCSPDNDSCINPDAPQVLSTACSSIITTNPCICFFREEFAQTMASVAATDVTAQVTMEEPTVNCALQ